MNIQALVGPLIKPGVDGLVRLTVMLLSALVPQLLVARTVILPVLNELLNITLMLLPLFSVILVPNGTLHTYPVAAVTVAMR